MSSFLIRNFIATAFLTSPIGIAAQAAAVPPAVSEVRASALATVALDADLAVVTIQFSAGGKTPALAGRAAATRANAIRAAVVAVGIPRDSMPTSGRWGRWGSRSDMRITNSLKDTAYVTNDQFAVRVRDLKLIGRVIDTAMAEGAQTISNVEFQATNTAAATIDALKKATVMARANATAIAEASGMRLGRPLELSTSSAQYPMASSANEGVMMARAMSAETTVVAPEMKVTMTVAGRWELVAPPR